MPAGSAAGPTRTKSLCITSRRWPAAPSATNFCSAAGECTSSTSASPRRPSSMAWPLPTARVLTCQPVSAVKAGSSSSSSPESWVLVVVARIRDFSADGPAAGALQPASASTAARTTRTSRIAAPFCSSSDACNPRVRAVTRYREICADVADQISRGDLRPGDELAGVRELARQWDTTASTVSRAQRELADAGLLDAGRAAPGPRRPRRRARRPPVPARRGGVHPRRQRRPGPRHRWPATCAAHCGWSRVRAASPGWASCAAAARTAPRSTCCTTPASTTPRSRPGCCAGSTRT